MHKMTIRTARANVNPRRQRTQFSCMSTSMLMCLQACGHQTSEDEVQKVMGATPAKGASWEQALATAQHYGCRATLTAPATIPQLKGWTDAGHAAMIAWNPEGREWSHASCVYDVTEGLPEDIPDTCTVQGAGPGLYVWVADPNIPHPEKTTRIVHEDVFYSKWYEKWPQYLVRRPAMAVEREITPGGRQVMASSKVAEPAVTFPYNLKKILDKVFTPHQWFVVGKAPSWASGVLSGKAAFPIRVDDLPAEELKYAARLLNRQLNVIDTKVVERGEYPILWIRIDVGRDPVKRSRRASSEAVVRRYLTKQAGSAKKMTGGSRKEVMQEVFDMYAKTYASIGMHLKTPEALLKYDVWEIGFDGDVPIFFSLFETTSFGLKAGLSGFDGSSAGKAMAVGDLRSKFKVSGVYGEVSHKVKSIALAAGAPAICSVYAQAIWNKMGKKIEYTDDPITYKRNLKGVGQVTKTMVGNPKGYPTTNGKNPSCPLPGVMASFAPTGPITMADDLLDSCAHAAEEAMSALLAE